MKVTDNRSMTNQIDLLPRSGTESEDEQIDKSE